MEQTPYESNYFLTNNWSSNDNPPVSTNCREHSISLTGSICNSGLATEEFETAFKYLKRNKAAGKDNISSNMFIYVYDEIKDLLFVMFKASLQQGTTQFNPLFKSSHLENDIHCRLIPVIPDFLKILERIFYIRLCKHLKGNLLHDKQFRFQLNNSRKYKILQLFNDVSSSLEKGKHTLGIFIDLSTKFDTVNHKIFISKLESYAEKGLTLS